MSTECMCSTAPKLIFACSGASDVGAIADQTARKLTREGAGKMSCLAGIGGRISGIMKNAEAASMLLAIDGCAQDCGKHCLEQAGFTKFKHLRVTDLGLEKGHAPPTEKAVERIAEKSKATPKK